MNAVGRVNRPRKISALPISSMTPAAPSLDASGTAWPPSAPNSFWTACWAKRKATTTRSRASATPSNRLIGVPPVGAGAARQGLAPPPPDQQSHEEDNHDVAPPRAEPGRPHRDERLALPRDAVAPGRGAPGVHLEDLGDLGQRKRAAGVAVVLVERSLLVLEPEARRRAPLRLQVAQLGALERGDDLLPAVERGQHLGDRRAVRRVESRVVGREGQRHRTGRGG